MQNQTANVTWRTGDVPVSTRFDDPYFSLEDGLAETRHVFLSGNGLPDRFLDGFHIAELGFGTGLNFLATAQAWQHSGQTGKLFFTSFEAFPMARSDIEQSLSSFGDFGTVKDQFLEAWDPAGGQFHVTPDITLEVVIGDARQTLGAWGNKADAWYLDGFSPAKNPELWGENLLAEVAKHTVSGGSCATYTAAGFVRRGLADAGFSVTRVSGYGRKRHMTTAVLE